MSLESRLAIEEFETLAKGVLLRGYYRPGGESGSSLRKLMAVSRPALYPYVNDPERVDAGALSYVLRRLPDGIWSVRQITVAREIESEVADDFDPVETPARRRQTFRTGESSYVTAFGGGMTDLLDFISALTCYQIESDKMRARYSAYRQKLEESPGTSSAWAIVDAWHPGAPEPSGEERKSLLHGLSVEMRSDYASVKALDASLGGRFLEVVASICRSAPRDLKVVFSERFGLVGKYSLKAKEWAAAVASVTNSRGAADSPVYIVSSNLHSVANCLSPFVREYASERGLDPALDYGELREELGTPGMLEARAKRDAEGGIVPVRVPAEMPFCQVAFLEAIEPSLADPRLGWDRRVEGTIVNMDYAFGEEGFFLFNELFELFGDRVRGVYIMGKAGTLGGARGDIMLPGFFVKQGSGEAYDIGNCLAPEDFAGLGGFAVHTGGPMLTVAGTFLQNNDVLRYFRDSWGALGVEMEGIPYAKALMHAVLRKRVKEGTRAGVCYYASDAPLAGDLLSIPLGSGGVGPVYAATIAILRSVYRLGSAQGRSAS
jgi:hypothetical protein